MERWKEWGKKGREGKGLGQGGDKGRNVNKGGRW